MKLSRYDDILFIETAENKLLGFHARNLEVAELSQVHARASLGSIEDLEFKQDISEWNQEVTTQAKTGILTPYVSSISLNVTQVCNLHCKYCAAGGDGTYGDPVKKISVEKTLPQLKNLLEKVPENEKFTIKFIGGEPLLYPQGVELLCEYAASVTRERNIQILFAVNTNATLINDSIVDILAKYRMSITVSIDGPSAVNGLNRVNKDGSNSTEASLKGLQKLTENHARFRNIGLSAVFDKNNMHIEEAFHFFRTLPVDWYEFNLSYEENSHEMSSEYVEKIKNIAAHAFDQGGEKALRKIKYFDHIFTLLDNQQRVENHCGAGKSYLVIDARNQVYVCPWMVGDPAEKVGQGSELDTQKLMAFQKPLIEENNCQTCWARYLCGGGCMYIHSKKTGAKNKVDSEFCYRTQSLISYAIIYYEKSRNLTLSERKVHENH